jgi:hypothetical protein
VRARYLRRKAPVPGILKRHSVSASSRQALDVTRPRDHRSLLLAPDSSVHPGEHGRAHLRQSVSGKCGDRQFRYRSAHEPGHLSLTYVCLGTQDHDPRAAPCNEFAHETGFIRPGHPVRLHAEQHEIGALQVPAGHLDPHSLDASGVLPQTRRVHQPKWVPIHADQGLDRVPCRPRLFGDQRSLKTQ